MPAARSRSEPTTPSPAGRSDQRVRKKGNSMTTQPVRKRSGLGRGLASLIPTSPGDGASPHLGPRMGDAAADVVLGGAPTQLDGAPLAPVGAVYREIESSAIGPNPRQPRQV